MVYTNKFVAVALVATTMLFLVVMIAEAQQVKDPKCILVGLPREIIGICYSTSNSTPSEECCKDLKSASDTQVTCLCDMIMTITMNPSNNITRAHYDQVHLACGVVDKFACKGKAANGGSTNKIAASMGLFGLVASLFF
ncbi:Non-specific lipid transfer protein GPI-anchored 33 [Cardamine amara subsp. amara]|uniref:Non-specific lipid transfer protein GPI-anchored 33 n=1 Tax=Cardamine amara subsp. amara TaxID=228776 RepID=A0ABD1A4C3_CARAN